MEEIDTGETNSQQDSRSRTESKWEKQRQVIETANRKAGSIRKSKEDTLQN